MGPPVRAGKLVALAVVANLLFVGASALVVAPVPTSRAMLSWYDGLPDPVRRVMGDGAGIHADQAERSAGSALDVEGRGPVGTWLVDLYRAAIAGDRNAQLALPLAVVSDVAADAWTANSTARLTWPVHGSDLTYRVGRTSGPAVPDLAAPGTMIVADGAATVPLQPGDNYVHVQATRGGKAGPVATMGPFRVDLSPPPAPFFPGGTQRTVDAFHFNVEWAPVHDAESGVAGYRIETGRSATTFTPFMDFPANVTVMEERNRPNGEYWYRVRAVNAAGALSEPSAPLRVTVEAAYDGPLPEPGAWHYGINATYDSVLHLYDLSDPGQYLRLHELKGPGHGGLSAAEYARYTGGGWGIALENQTLRQIVAQEVGGETNSLLIAMGLYEWLFNATDYDFDKLDATESNFLRANETYDRGMGICGDLTSLYVTMLRIAGVPARPVHGYLINSDPGGQGFERTIGGFHMWAEVYVGGDDPAGGGWIPVDVSGVTDTFKKEYLAIYFGVANPNYLQLGVQEELGAEGDTDGNGKDDEAEDKWNVWAKVGWRYPHGTTPQAPVFDADAFLTEDTTRAVKGRLYFDSVTLQRVFCEDGAPASCRQGLSNYFEDVKGRSVRHIDYGADLTWGEGVIDLELRVKFPERVAPNQVVLFTQYERDPACVAQEAAPPQVGNGFVEWQIDGDVPPCSV